MNTSRFIAAVSLITILGCGNSTNSTDTTPTPTPAPIVKTGHVRFASYNTVNRDEGYLLVCLVEEKECFAHRYPDSSDVLLGQRRGLELQEAKEQHSTVSLTIGDLPKNTASAYRRAGCVYFTDIKINEGHPSENVSQKKSY